MPTSPPPNDIWEENPSPYGVEIVIGDGTYNVQIVIPASISQIAKEMMADVLAETRPIEKPPIVSPESGE